MLLKWFSHIWQDGMHKAIVGPSESRRIRFYFLDVTIIYFGQDWCSDWCRSSLCWFSLFCQNVRLFFSFSYAAYKIQRTLENRLLCIHLHAVKPSCHCCKWDKSPWCLPSIWADRFGAWVSVWVWLWTLVLGIKQSGRHCGDGLLFMARLWRYNKTFLYV